MSLREQLLDPEVWPVRAAEVEFLETHISELYFVGDRVYKVKKEVDLGFLDFRSLEARRFYCEEELALNRRLSPDVYLGICEIRESAGGRIHVGGQGALREYAVEMVRLPAERMLACLLDRGDIDNSMMRALSGLLQRFHAGAERSAGIDVHGMPEAVGRNALENFEQTRQQAWTGEQPVVTSPQLVWLESWTRGFLREHHALMMRRVAQRRICDGHGDLHAGNICFLEPDGEASVEERIRIYDCLEFSPRYRQGDVACDLAFLLMDLDARGYRAFASYLLHVYAQASGDQELEDLIPFYKCYRACVRGKVALLRSVQLAGAASEEARRESRSYFQLALAYCLPPVLILVCGLPACGKSVAAVDLARPFEARILSSDRLRKTRHGLGPEARTASPLGGGIYAPAASEDVYRELLGLARESLTDGRCVVVDAGFRGAAERTALLELARDLGVPCTLLHLEVSEEVTRARMDLRAADAQAVSEADWSVYQSLVPGFEPCVEIPAQQRVEASGELEGGILASMVLDSLLSQVGRSRSG